MKFEFMLLGFWLLTNFATSAFASKYFGFDEPSLAEVQQKMNVEIGDVLYHNENTALKRKRISVKIIGFVPETNSVLVDNSSCIGETHKCRRLKKRSHLQ